MWICPPGRLEYQCCARPFREITNAFTLQAAPPLDASMAASYLRRKSLGSESPSNCGRMVGVEAWGPRELFEFYGEGRGGVLLWMKLLWAKLMWYHVLALLFVRVMIFDDGLLAKPLRLRRLLHGFGVLAKGLHHYQTISKRLSHCLAAKFLFL